jgi:hypothetical protein
MKGGTDGINNPPERKRYHLVTAATGRAHRFVLRIPGHGWLAFSFVSSTTTLGAQLPVLPRGVLVGVESA